MSDIERVKQKGIDLEIQTVTSFGDVMYPITKKDDLLRFIPKDSRDVVILENKEILLAEFSPTSLRKYCVELKRSIGVESVVKLTTQDIIDQLLATRQSEKDSKKVEVRTADEDLSRSNSQMLLDILVKQAIEAKASDIHFITDTTNNVVHLKFRQLGKLKNVKLPITLTTEMVHNMCGVIVSHESHKSGGSSQEEFNETAPNSASCMIDTAAGKVSIRYNHEPTASPKGLDVAMRIHSLQAAAVPSFASLGYTLYEQALQERAFSFPHGLVLYTGPTGSGKSTALAAGISLLPNTLKKIAYEDPIETNMVGVEQIQVNSKNPKTTYAAYSKVVLRQDPDVVIYGEIRDEEVMKEAKSQANTGHLVLSTLHTNGAVEALARMENLGVSFEDLASNGLVRAIIAQRLVAKLCPTCCVPITEVITKPWKTDDHMRVHAYFNENYPTKLSRLSVKNIHNNDCDVCKGAGEIGRMPIVEILLLDNAGREFIKAGDISGFRNHIVSNGWQDMTHNALQKVLKGMICPLTAESKVDMPYEDGGAIFNYDEFFKKVDGRHRDRITSMIKPRAAG